MADKLEDIETQVDGNQYIGFALKLKGEQKFLMPREIASYIIKELKKMAEKELDKDEIKDVCITIPAYYLVNSEQEKATIQACRLAGFSNI